MKTVKVTLTVNVQTADPSDEEQLLSDTLDTIVDSIEEGTLDYNTDTDDDEDEDF